MLRSPEKREPPMQLAGFMFGFRHFLGQGAMLGPVPIQALKQVSGEWRGQLGLAFAGLFPKSSVSFGLLLWLPIYLSRFGGRLISGLKAHV